MEKSRSLWTLRSSNLEVLTLCKNTVNDRLELQSQFTKLSSGRKAFGIKVCNQSCPFLTAARRPRSAKKLLDTSTTSERCSLGEVLVENGKFYIANIIEPFPQSGLIA